MRATFLACLLSTLICLCGVDSARAFGGGEEDPTGIGQLCLRGPAKDRQRLLSALEREGFPVRPSGKTNCYVEGQVGLEVPLGLEGWTQIFIKKNFPTIVVEFGQATAGGSGILKSRVKRKQFFDASFTPDNIDEKANELECAIESRLRSYFEDVNVTSGCGSSKEGFCFEFWVGGHLSDSRGLSSEDLRGQYSSRYWFTSRQVLWVSYFAFYSTNPYDPDAPLLKDIYRVDLATLSSKFALSPKSDRPDASEYESSPGSGVSIDDDAVDTLVAHRLEKILFSKKLQCNR